MKSICRRTMLLTAMPLVLAARVQAQTPPVQVYAAMTFRKALDPVLAASPVPAIAVYAPTPVLVRQIAAGAPADILLTADPDWMNNAALQNLIQTDTRTNLLANDLILASQRGTASAGTITASFPLLAFLAGSRIAMCDPEHDPAGRYAREALLALGLWQQIESAIAIAESAPAAVTLVDRGEVRAAMCFKTDLFGDDHATEVGTFPEDSHSPILYPVALTRTPPSANAALVLSHLGSHEAAAMFSRFGYRSPA